MRSPIIFFIFIFISYSIRAQQRKHLIYENTAELPNALISWSYIEAPTKNSIVISDSIAHHGHYSFKFVLNKQDSTIGGGKRTEVTLRYKSAVKVERWIGFSVFLPASFMVDPEPEIIQQWHDIPNSAAVKRSPCFALSTQNGHWLISIRSSSELSRTATATYDLGAYNNSVWTNWVFHIRFSWANDGLIEVWKNGVLLKTINGPNEYEDISGNYFKLGIYKWVWMPEKDRGLSTTNTREVYYDDIRIGDDKAGFKDVTP